MLAHCTNRVCGPGIDYEEFVLAACRYKAFRAAIKSLADCVAAGRKLYGLQLESLEDMFGVIAAHRGRADGTIDFVGLSDALKRLGIGMSLDDQRAVFTGLDSDGGGSISIKEFLGVVNNHEAARLAQGKFAVNKHGKYQTA